MIRFSFQECFPYPLPCREGKSVCISEQSVPRAVGGSGELLSPGRPVNRTARLRMWSLGCDVRIPPLLGKEAFGFKRGHAAHAGRSDGLSIYVIGDVACGKYAGD